MQWYRLWVTISWSTVQTSWIANWETSALVNFLFALIHRLCRSIPYLGITKNRSSECKPWAIYAGIPTYGNLVRFFHAFTMTEINMIWWRSVCCNNEVIRSVPGKKQKTEKPARNLSILNASLISDCVKVNMQKLVSTVTDRNCYRDLGSSWGLWPPGFTAISFTRKYSLAQKRCQAGI